jgi:hypothetical protein
MNYLLSYGAGVNSTAMILLMETTCEFQAIFHQLHIVFADTGSEHPQTYTFLETMDGYLAQRGQRIRRVRAEQTLLEMCHQRKFLPSRMSRWCTVESKLKPLWDYEKRVFGINPNRNELQVTRFIGIDAGESHRIRHVPQRYAVHRYPLIEYDLDREACQRLIEKSGLPVPRKSGCYLCPFSARHELAQLSIEHPDLFEAMLQLEHTVNATWKVREAPFHLIQGLPLSQLFEQRDEILARHRNKQQRATIQPGLFDSLEAEALEDKLDALPCLCGR